LECHGTVYLSSPSAFTNLVESWKIGNRTRLRVCTRPHRCQICQRRPPSFAANHDESPNAATGEMRGRAKIGQDVPGYPNLGRSPNRLLICSRWIDRSLWKSWCMISGGMSPWTCKYVYLAILQGEGSAVAVSCTNYSCTNFTSG
jgi:hypothetical protein